MVEVHFDAEFGLQEEFNLDLRLFKIQLLRRLFQQKRIKQRIFLDIFFLRSSIRRVSRPVVGNVMKIELLYEFRHIAGARIHHAHDLTKCRTAKSEKCKEHDNGADLPDALHGSVRGICP